MEGSSNNNNNTYKYDSNIFKKVEKYPEAIAIYNRNIVKETKKHPEDIIIYKPKNKIINNYPCSDKILGTIKDGAESKLEIIKTIEKSFHKQDYFSYDIKAAAKRYDSCETDEKRCLFRTKYFNLSIVYFMNIMEYFKLEYNFKDMVNMYSPLWDMDPTNDIRLGLTQSENGERGIIFVECVVVYSIGTIESFNNYLMRKDYDFLVFYIHEDTYGRCVEILKIIGIYYTQFYIDKYLSYDILEADKNRKV